MTMNSYPCLWHAAAYAFSAVLGCDIDVMTKYLVTLFNYSIRLAEKSSFLLRYRNHTSKEFEMGNLETPGDGAL